MKNNKKAVAVLSLMMLASLSFTAIADTASAGNVLAVGSNGVEGTNGETVMSFVKDLKLTDVDDSEFIPTTPDLTFAYSITAGEAAEETKKDSDGKDVKVPIKAGVQTDKINVSDATFTASDSTESGKSYVRHTVEVDFSGVTFTASGIYRYVITEGDYTSENGYSYTEADLAKITGENAERTLDVYVEKAEDGSFKIAGYVLYKTTGENNKEKSIGYDVDSKDIDGTDAIPAFSEYKTYDMTLTQKVTGPMADPEKEFDFTLTLDQPSTAKYKLTDRDNTASDITSGSTPSVKLKDSESVTIQGLPISAGFVVKEKDATGDGYTGSYSVDETDKGKLTKEDGTTVHYVTEEIGDNAADTDKTDVVITNTIKEIPVTGIAMDVAPYAAMLGIAGLMGGSFLMKRRHEEE